MDRKFCAIMRVLCSLFLLVLATAGQKAKADGRIEWSSLFSKPYSLAIPDTFFCNNANTALAEVLNRELDQFITAFKNKGLSSCIDHSEHTHL
jgi:hypothetical protein